MEKEPGLLRLTWNRGFPGGVVSGLGDNQVIDFPQGGFSYRRLFFRVHIGFDLFIPLKIGLLKNKFIQ